MPAGAEAPVPDLKDLRGNWPRIVVVQAVDQRGKGLDVGRQPRETENRLAIRNGKIAIRSEQVCIPVSKVGQEQDARQCWVKTLQAECGDHSIGVSDGFRLDYSEKSARVVNRL